VTSAQSLVRDSAPQQWWTGGLSLCLARETPFVRRCVRLGFGWLCGCLLQLLGGGKVRCLGCLVSVGAGGGGL